MFGGASFSSLCWFDRSDRFQQAASNPVALQPFPVWVAELVKWMEVQAVRVQCAMPALCAARRPELGFMPAALWRAHGPVTRAHSHTNRGR